MFLQIYKRNYLNVLAQRHLSSVTKVSVFLLKDVNYFYYVFKLTCFCRSVLLKILFAKLRTINILYRNYILRVKYSLKVLCSFHEAY